jgi:beta-glucosidase-like glycosyl hydrolase
VVPGLTEGEPASLSSAAITELLRTELGFDGLVMTDALDMDAIAAGYTASEAAERALSAGADLAMLGRLSDVETSLESLIDAINEDRLSLSAVNRSFLRVLEAKDLTVCDLPAEIAPAIRCDGVSSGGCALVGG